MRIALTRQLVDNRSAGIAKPHHLRTLVDGFTGSIVNGLPKHFHVVVSFDFHNLAVAAAHQQTEERQWRLTVVIGTLLDEVSHHMPLQVIDIDKRNAETPGKSFGKAHAYQQRPHQTRSTGEGDSRQLFLGNASSFDGLVDNRHHVLLMGARCQLWHNASVGTMHVLRSSHVAQQYSVAQHSRRRVVAATFYT